MDHQLRELIKNQNEFFDQVKVETWSSHPDIRAQEADILWEASRFFSTIIHKASSSSRFVTHDEFLFFKKDFESRHGRTLDAQSLFKRFWLRNVMGFVWIAGSVSSMLYRFRTFKDYKNELLFWLEFQKGLEPEQKKVLTKSDIEGAVSSYEDKYSVKLDEKAIFLPGWASIKENDEVSFSDFESYFKHFAEHWDDFLFISELQFDKRTDESSSLLIEKIELESIHLKFQGLYPSIPSIDEFKSQHVLSDAGNSYSLNFHNTEPHYWSGLADKLSGLLWEAIVNDNSFTNDHERLKMWLTKVMHWSDSPQPLGYTQENSRKKFLTAAFELVINEPDLLDAENEYAKAGLDGRFSSDSFYGYQKAIDLKLYTINTSDAYEILVSFHRWQSRGDGNFLYEQGTRTFLGFLIRQIVSHDLEYSTAAHTDSLKEGVVYFRRIVSLLHAGMKKPYLIWKVTQAILSSRLKVIPYLLIEPGFETLAFILLDEIKFLSESKTEFNVQVWKKSMTIFLHNLPRDDKAGAAKKIFQVYRSLNRRKYDTSFNHSNRLLETTRESHEKKERTVLELIEDSRLHPRLLSKYDSEYLLPVLFKDLADEVIAFKTKSVYSNGTVQFPILQWDVMSWLLKASTYWKYQKQISLVDEPANFLTKEFVQMYLASIELTEVEKYNYFEDKEEKGLPLWSEKIERLHFIEWMYPIYLMHDKGLLNRFLTPRIDIENTTDPYHEKNRFNADKLRTHIGVLLQVLRKLILPTLPYGFESEKLKAIKERIEQQIVDYLQNHIVNQPDMGKIDLFDFNREWRFNSTDTEALFPQIARAINWFSNKDAIVNTISESGDVAKLLALLDWVKSEGVRLKVFDKIKTLDIKAFLEEYQWITEAHHTITHLLHHRELLPQIEEAVTFWKELIAKRKNNEYKMVLYRAELLVAYFKESEQLLTNVEEPEISYHSTSELSPNGYKEFYRGLLFIRSEPLKAHGIFNALVNRYPQYASFALNRMVAKINFGQSQSDPKPYREALEEWRDYEKQLEKSVRDSLEPNLTTNIMTVLAQIKDYKELEAKFGQLDLPSRMQPDVIQIMTQSLIDQGRISEALLLTDSARTYHQFSDINNIQFINDIENAINQIDNLDELKNNYNTIFRSEPKKLIRIFPEDLNGKTDLNEFIVKEFLLAVDKMLEKIQAIGSIAGEDKYNDLIELSLDSRINPWGWQIGAQSRGGYSGTGGNQPGERDLPLMNKNKQVIIVGEAFVYRGASTAKSHLEKVFNYHHKRNAFIILVYDLSNSTDDYSKNWKEYSTNIVPSASYPVGYEFSGIINDVSKDFGYGTSAIKVFSSKHGSDTTLYHMYVHINYRLPVIKPVKIRRKKKK